MKRNRKYMITALFIIFGGTAGFAYYYFVGCSGGGCPIQSNPYISTVYGGLLGFVISGMFVKSNKNETSEKEL